jgi:hypothetical protein
MTTSLNSAVWWPRRPARTGARVILAAALSLLALIQPAEAADPLKPVRAVTPPVIDGDLSDPVWQAAPTVTGFKTWMPDFGIEMKDQTVVYYAYDAENLYFAFRAFDAEPSRIKASVAARDSILADDWICINLDGFGDQQSLYALYVNPLGIQADSRFAANREDVGFDAVWYSAGRIDDKGYTVEVRIPFKSLRYGGSNPVRMRLIFERRVSRRAEQGTYPALDPKVGPNFLTQNIPIEFADIRHYTLLEVLPDATYNQQRTRPAGTLRRVSGGPDAGVTVKYGVTAQLTMDGTYNPDFSQVEADAGQIDINRRYPLFFAEKRPFFLEGRDSFNFAGADYSPLQAVVHTRTIGNPLVGVKLTGKTGPSDTLASIYALDELAPSAAGRSGSSYAQAAILRYKRALAGDAYLGGFYTGREEGGAFNRVFGADGTLRVTPASTVGFYAFGSATRPEGEPTAAGSALLASFQHDSRAVSVYLGALNITRRFDTWSGYLTRAGIFEATASVTPRLYPKSALWRRIDFPLTSDHVRDADSGLWEAFNSAGVTVVTSRAVRVSAAYHYSSEVFLGESFGTSGVQLSASAQLTKQLTVTTTASHQNAIYYSSTPFGGLSSSAAVAVRYEPSDKWQAELRTTYAGFSRPDDGGRIYDYTILRGKATFQFNKYVFLRGIAEYNAYYRQLVTDMLVSFTYIPGTVVHAGYGSLYEKVRWTGESFVPGASLVETRRGFFLKASYLWRM